MTMTESEIDALMARQLQRSIERNSRLVIALTKIKALIEQGDYADGHYPALEILAIIRRSINDQPE